MRKLTLIILLAIGTMFTTITPLAEENQSEVEIQEETTPEAYRKNNNEELIFKFAIFCGFVVVIGGVIIKIRNQKGFALHATELNDDGSYTVTIRSKEVKKMVDAPEDIHVIIRQGSCIFLKKPDFASSGITSNDDLFVAVVNDKSIIEFNFRNETLVIDGKELQSKQMNK
ncbi:hypothetical protein [Anaerorhabdus sp.]|jgi:hypothetical protein|uniref:hypothetical protein n=1 Tax=Anaerorhabdus sp. TaxID=1872524 RepID=UPI002FC6BE7A